MFGLLRKGAKAVATGNAQASMGLQSPHMPMAVTRIGRFLFSSSAIWIGTVWYTAFANKRTQTGSGPTLVMPGKPIINSPDRPEHTPKFTTSISKGKGKDNTPVSTTAGDLGNSTKFSTTPAQASRKLDVVSPDNMGVPGVAVGGFLWSAPPGKKIIPAYNKITYGSLTPVASHIAQTFGLKITSGYRPGSSGSNGLDLHSAGLAFDMVGPLSSMKKAATWAATNPAMFQEIFIHNEGSGMHLHLGFYPDSASIYNSGTNRMVRKTSQPQKHVA